MSVRRGKSRNGGRGKKTELQPEEIQEDDVKCAKCDKFLWEKLDDSEAEENKNLECEVCLRWFHAACTPDGEATHDILEKQKSMHWYCKQCNHAATELHKKIAALQTENAKLRKDINSLTTKVTKGEKAMDETCKTLVSNLFNEKKAELKEELHTDLKADIEQEMINAVPDDDGNPWSKVVSRRHEPAQPANPPTIPNLRNIISQELSEKSKIDLLKFNLIISGMNEQEGTEEEISNADKEKATAIITQELGIEPDIQKVERCGRKKVQKQGEPEPKPRPLRIVLSSLETRKDILMNATKLRNSDDTDIKSDVYINPDLTKAQQLEAKNLRKDLRDLKQLHPENRYKIKNGQIVQIHQT